jgi:hypothetical protein
MFSLNQPSSQASRDRGALDGTGYGHGQSLAGGADTMGAAQGDERGRRGMRDRNLIGAASPGWRLELDQACDPAGR